MDVKGLKKALPICFEAGVTMLITGAHGLGKSQGVRQAIEGQGLGQVWDFRLGQMADTGDIVGLLDVENKANYCKFKIPERIRDVVEYCNANPDKYGVLFFDEMNRTTKDILQAIFQIVLDHELNGLKFPKNMKAVCAINPATDDYSVLDFDDKAFADRFCHIKFEPTVSDWLEYARECKLDPTITGFIGESNDMLEEQYQDFDLPAKPSRRTWFTVDRIKKICHDNALFQELLIGMLGIDVAGAYIGYLNKYEDVIKGIEVLEEFKKHKKKIEQFSSVETDRSDMLRNICDQIKDEFKKLDTIPKKWEDNFAAFICTIPRDLGMGFMNDMFEVPSFCNTESDPEDGFAGERFKASKKILDHYRGWQKKLKEEKEEESNV